jgi:hypothetical protein
MVHIRMPYNLNAHSPTGLEKFCVGDSLPQQLQLLEQWTEENINVFICRRGPSQGKVCGYMIQQPIGVWWMILNMVIISLEL